MKAVRKTTTLLAAVALAAGCGEDATTPEVERLDEELVTLDVATLAAEATLDDVRSMVLPLEVFGGGPLLGGGPFGRDGRHGFHPGGGMAAGDRITRERTVTFFDADGAEMEGFDELLTDRVRLQMTVSGSVERNVWSASVERSRDMTVSGLAGEETRRTWNGTGSSLVQRTRFSDESGDRSYTAESASTVAEVVVGVPRRDNPWPLSGTITRQMRVTIVNGPNGDETRERTVVIEFDGTQFATLTVDGEVFQVDLADRQGRRPERKRRGG